MKLKSLEELISIYGWIVYHQETYLTPEFDLIRKNWIKTINSLSNDLKESTIDDTVFNQIVDEMLKMLKFY